MTATRPIQGRAPLLGVGGLTVSHRAAMLRTPMRNRGLRGALWEEYGSSRNGHLISSKCPLVDGRNPAGPNTYHTTRMPTVLVSKVVQDCYQAVTSKQSKTSWLSITVEVGKWNMTVLQANLRKRETSTNRATSMFQLFGVYRMVLSSSAS